MLWWLKKQIKSQQCMWIYSKFRRSDRVQDVSLKTITSRKFLSFSVALKSVSVWLCWALAAGTGRDLPISSSQTSRCTLGFSGRSAQGEPIWAPRLWCRAAILIREHWEALLCCTGGSEVNWLLLHRVDSYLSQLASMWQSEQRGQRFSLGTSRSGISTRHYR